MPFTDIDEWGIGYEIRFNEGNHSRPHVHVHYKELEASISIEDLEVLAGEFPSKALKRAKNYISNNKTKLMNDWNNAKKGINFLKK